MNMVRPFALRRLRLLDEIDIAPFRAERGQDDQYDRRRPRDQRESEAVIIAMRLGEAGLEGAVAGGDEVAELIGETREHAPDQRRRKLVQMDRHDSPGALHRDLEQEGAEPEQQRRLTE